MRSALVLGALLCACSGSSGEISGESAGAIGPDARAHVQVLVEPGDNGSALVAALQAAKTSIHMTMYLLSDDGVLNALIAQRKAGVEVKVVLNKIVHAGGRTFVPNQPSFDALTAAGVEVAWAPAKYALTHEKAIVIDGVTAWIMTMNAATASMTSNREFLVVDTLKADVAEAEAQFQADYAGQPFEPAGSLVVAPVNARDRITALVDGAKTTLDLEAEELSDRQMAASLCAATARGVAVRALVSNKNASQTEKTTLESLKACGVTTVTLKHPYIHAKAIVADGAHAYIGSANLSQHSLDRNRELGIITSTHSAVAVVADTVTKDIAAATPL
jgi:cardiolipin synthase A/B